MSLPISADAVRAVMAWWEQSGVDVPAVKTPSKRKMSSRPSSRSSARPPANTLKAQSASPAQNASRSTARPAAPTPAPKTELAEKLSSASAIAKAAPNLDALKIAVQGFDAGDLAANASQAVFARGNKDAKIMVIGESPGKQEDEAGEPFIGPAGQLLTRMLSSIQLGEDDVYITNVCNWRPLKNNKPSADEVALSMPFITRHIELAAPDFILLVGGVSLEALCGIKGIMKTRGQWQTLSIGGRDIPALPLYHPAFLLRRPELKREAWHDLLSFKDKIGG